MDKNIVRQAKSALNQRQKVRMELHALQRRMKELCIVMAVVVLFAAVWSTGYVFTRWYYTPTPVVQTVIDAPESFYNMTHAVVMLRVDGTKTHPFYPVDPNGNPTLIDVTWYGSGVLVDDAGTILTANHVVRNAKKITIIDYDGNEYEASGCYGTTYADIGIVQTSPKTPLRLVSLASQPAEVGDIVFSCGLYTGGLTNSFSRGIVGHTNRTLTDLGYDKPVIQTDTAAAPGSSGCPIYNEMGRVIGILVSGVDSGCNFAVPIDQVRVVYDWYKAHNTLEGL